MDEYVLGPSSRPDVDYAPERGFRPNAHDPSVLPPPGVGGVAFDGNEQAAAEDHEEVHIAGCEDARRRSAAAPKIDLKVSFLSTFRASAGDGEVLLLGRNAKALAILKYLLAHRHRPVGRGFIMDWLWRDSHPRRAHWSLNSAICALRKILNASLPPLKHPGYVLLDEGRYRLLPQLQVTTDVEEFDAHVERGRRLQKNGYVVDAVGEYEKAVELYGEGYLPEDIYEDWTMVERERIRCAYLHASSTVAAYRGEHGDVQDCMQACFRILQEERCHEGAHRLLATCFARLGQRHRVLDQYRLYERLLKQQYDLAPTPEMSAFCRSLSRGENGEDLTGAGRARGFA